MSKKNIKKENNTDTIENKKVNDNKYTIKNKKIPFINFVKFMNIATIVSSILFIISIVLFVNKITTNSFNMGIDFAGGVELKVQIDNTEIINIADIRSLYNNFNGETK